MEFDMNVAGVLGDVLSLPSWSFGGVPVQPDAVSPNPNWDAPSQGVQIGIIGTTQGTYQEPWPQG